MNSLINYMKDTLPRYSIKQPSTQKLITFRPFTVKEEKMLLIGNQTGSTVDFLATLEQIIKNCFDFSGDVKKLPMFDVEYFFLKLRAKSVAEITTPTIVCPTTNEKIKLEINLDEVEPIFTPNHTKEIKLANNILVKMKYPCLGSLMEKQNMDHYDLIIDCIDQIQTPNDLIESSLVSRSVVEEFVDLLTKEQFLKLIDFIKSMPKIEYKTKYKTSDGVEREIVLKGIRDFFR
jgi:hypothetical protein